MDERATTIKRLVRMVFGSKTEKRDNVLKKADESNDNNDKKSSQSEPNNAKDGKKKPKKKGHGRNGVAAYKGADHVRVPHPDLKGGDPCPDCLEGKLYINTEPGYEIRFKG